MSNSNCTNCDYSKVNIRFAEAIFSIYKEMKFGIETCCHENRDIDILNFELLELMDKFDEELTPLL
jgi:hypothetical protein